MCIDCLGKVAEIDIKQDVRGLNRTLKTFYSVKENCDLLCLLTEDAEATKPSARLLHPHLPLRLVSPEELWIETELHPEGPQDRKEQGTGPKQLRCSSKE